MEAAQPADSGVLLLLHRLTLDQGTRDAIAKLGVRIASSGSVGRTLRLMDESPDRVMIAFDVAGSGNAPERLVSAARQSPRASRVDLLPASTKRSDAAALRAKRLGFSEAWLWPHGAYAEFLRRLEVDIQISFRRAAPRAALAGGLGRMELGNGLSAEVMNISSTGALLETDPSAGDIEAIGLEISLGGKTFVVLARVVWSEVDDRKLRLGVQFAGADAESRAAIDSFVRSVNVLSPDQPTPDLQFHKPARQHVRVRHEGRSDWFDLEGEVTGGGTLVPKKAFFVPYRVGDAVEVEVASGSGKRVAHAMRIIGSAMLDPRRIDSRIAWHVVPRDLDAPAGTFSDVQDLLRMPTEVMAERGPSVAELVSLWRGNQLEGALGNNAWFVLTPPPQRPGSDVRTGGMQTRTFFAKRREGAPELDASFLLVPLGGEEPTVVGRSRSCGIYLPLLNVSKKHASIALDGASGELRLVDLGSSNGTSLVRLEQGEPQLERLAPETPTAVRDKDIVLVDRHPLHVFSRARLIAGIEALARMTERG